jgi:uncharacterized protein YlxW (UPF0749 family)
MDDDTNTTTTSRRRRRAGAATPVQRLLAALRPRASRGQVLGALLCGVLGFALVVQVQQTQGAELDSLRDSDLIRILDDISERTDRLESEAARLAATRQDLLTSSDAAQAAQDAAQERVDVLSILAGTAPATGPGVRMTISDADAQLGAAVLLDAVQELRDAGAEAIQIDDVRVVASTAFVDTAAGIEVDGRLVESPYVVLAIGDAPTISTALDIPGGVLRTVRQREGTASVEELDQVVVDALRVPSEPEYARPADPGTP